jgi:rubrerythrin
MTRPGVLLVCRHCGLRWTARHVQNNTECPYCGNARPGFVETSKQFRKVTP